MLGAYTPPAATTIPAGVSILSNPSFDTLSLSNSAFSLQPSTLSTWAFDSEVQAWRAQLAQLQTNALPTLAPGDALFVRTDTGATNDGPDTTLTVRYYHEDHIGSSTVLTDADGQLVEETANYPFGHARQQFQPRMLHESYQFTQKETDKETEFSYLDARYLSTQIGRFASCDPILQAKFVTLIPQGLNPYSYCRSRPLRLVDPTGYEGEEPNPMPNPGPQAAPEPPPQSSSSDRKPLGDVVGGKVFEVAKEGTKMVLSVAKEAVKKAPEDFGKGAAGAVGFAKGMVGWAFDGADIYRAGQERGKQGACEKTVEIVAGKVAVAGVAACTEGVGILASTAINKATKWVVAETGLSKALCESILAPSAPLDPNAQPTPQPGPRPPSEQTTPKGSPTPQSKPSQ